MIDVYRVTKAADALSPMGRQIGALVQMAAARDQAMVRAVDAASPTAGLVSAMLAAGGLWERMRAPLGRVSFVPPGGAREVVTLSTSEAAPSGAALQSQNAAIAATT